MVFYGTSSFLWLLGIPKYFVIKGEPEVLVSNLKMKQGMLVHYSENSLHGIAFLWFLLSILEIMVYFEVLNVFGELWLTCLYGLNLTPGIVYISTELIFPPRNYLPVFLEIEHRWEILNPFLLRCHKTLTKSPKFLTPTAAKPGVINFLVLNMSYYPHLAGM